MESKKRLYDLFPELKKQYDTTHPNPNQQSVKTVRHLIANPEAAVQNPVDFNTADTEILKDGLEHPKHTQKLNLLRRKLGINSV